MRHLKTMPAVGQDASQRVTDSLPITLMAPCLFYPLVHGKADLEVHAPRNRGKQRARALAARVAPEIIVTGEELPMSHEAA